MALLSGVNLSCESASLRTPPQVRQGINSLSNSESPLKRTNELKNPAFQSSFRGL